MAAPSSSLYGRLEEGVLLLISIDHVFYTWPASMSKKLKRWVCQKSNFECTSVYFSSMLSPRQVFSLFPLSQKEREWIAYSRHMAQEILVGKDPRKVIVVGPCSIHDKHAALEYAEKLKSLYSEVKEACYLVMRVYLEKSRTRSGWKGLAYDPYLDGSHAIETGILLGRELLTELVRMQVPIATEFVDPLMSPYFQDLISWGFIGARSATSQPHRQLASHLTFPVGFKNTLSGDIQDAIDGVLTANIPHSFLNMDLDGRIRKEISAGNPLCHIVLRGSKSESNYDLVSIEKALQALKEAGSLPRLMIDCAHGNSQKNPEQQAHAFLQILEHIEQRHLPIFGLMLESHLKEGNQPLSSQLDYAVSVTDPCIGWNLTKELILRAAKTLNNAIS